MSEMTPGSVAKLPPVTLVYEGRGGTFYYGLDVNQKYLENQAKLATFRNITNKSTPADKTTDYFLLTKAIGTEGLVSCVALFFKIGTDRLFFAHMDICVQGQGRGHILELKEGAEVETAVWDRLVNLSRKQGWSAAEVDKESVRVVCPKVKAGPKTNAAAVCVRNGMALFLGMRSGDQVQMKSW